MLYTHWGESREEVNSDIERGNPNYLPGVRAERRSTVMRTLPLLPPGIYATGIQRERIKPNTELNRRFKTSKGEMKQTGG